MKSNVSRPVMEPSSVLQNRKVRYIKKDKNEIMKESERKDVITIIERVI